jgi:hypothetical protein
MPGDTTASAPESRPPAYRLKCQLTGTAQKLQPVLLVAAQAVVIT